MLMVALLVALHEYKYYIEQKKFCKVSFATICSFLLAPYFMVAMLGTLCLVEFCGPCMRVVNYEYYEVSNLNHTNIISIIKSEISNLLKICRPTTSK